MGAGGEGRGGGVPICHCWGWVLLLRGGYGEVWVGVGAVILDFLVYGVPCGGQGSAAGSGGWKMIARQSVVTSTDRMAPNSCESSMDLRMDGVFAVILPVSTLGLIWMLGAGAKM